MKISVITWDCNFREHLHTIRFFCEQNFDKNEYEFIWVDFYNSNDLVRKEIEKYSNAKLITLNNPEDTQWHLGKCINAGVKEAKGDLLIIPDGDIVVENDFLNYISNCCDEKRLVSFFRRYDETQETSSSESRTNIEYLEKHTKLFNATNYAGCYSIRKEDFLSINGYEENGAFAGPGMNAMELYIRMRSAGYKIQWLDKKIFHPWHENTGLSSIEMKKKELLALAKQHFPWIQPYSGLKQSWITFQREKLLISKADIVDSEKLLEKMPNINLEEFETQNQKIKRLNQKIEEQQQKITIIENSLVFKLYRKLIKVSNLLSNKKG